VQRGAVAAIETLDEVQPSRRRERWARLVGLGDDVVAQRERHVLRVRHRLDAGGVDGGELVDQRKIASSFARTSSA
jgi:hypothetical protein